MTLIYQAEPAAVTPGTHVLAIAVGRYPHLLGGDPGALANKPLGLKQLKSPPVSLRHLLDWCFAPQLHPDPPASPGLVNNQAPLASVEVLVSADEPFVAQTPNGQCDVERATRNNIQLAFESWLVRMRTHPGNIGVFYFCGHGIMVSDHYLLADDFGASPAQPWANAFDISNTMRAAEREVNGGMYFFIDACREISRDVAMTLAANPSPLWAPDLSKRLISSSLTAIYATGEGELAYAPLGGEVSRFTSALVCALSGYCGIKAPGTQTWNVTGETLAAAVRNILNVEHEYSQVKPNQKQVSEQQIRGEPVPILTLSRPPLVKVVLDLDPVQRRVMYDLYLQSVLGGRYSQSCLNQAFRIDLPRGFYEVGALDPAGGLPHVHHQEEELVPPFYTLTMRSQP